MRNKISLRIIQCRNCLRFENKQVKKKETPGIFHFMVESGFTGYLLALMIAIWDANSHKS